MAFTFVLTVKGLDANIKLLMSKNPEDTLPLQLNRGQAVSPLLLQYDHNRGTNPGILAGHTAWGLLGHLGEMAANDDYTADGVSGVTSFDTWLHCGKPLYKINVFSNESMDISALGSAAYNLKHIGASLQLDEYVQCESLRARIIFGKYSAGAGTLFHSLYSAMVQHCYDNLYFGKQYQPLIYTVYALPSSLDFDDVSIVSMLFVLSFVILNPTFSFANLLDCSVAARVEGRKLILHSNGLSPFSFHWAHYIMLFGLTYASFIISWLASLAGQVKWSIVHPVLPVIGFFAAAFEIAVIVFAMSMTFKTRESFRNNFPTYLMGLLYAPSFITSFAGSSLPNFMSVILCIFPSTLLAKLFTTMAYYGFHSRGTFSLVDLREAMYEKRMLLYILFTTIYGCVIIILTTMLDKPYRHGRKRGDAKLTQLQKTPNQKEYANVTVGKGDPFMLNVMKESEAVQKELSNTQVLSSTEVIGKVVIHNLGKVYQVSSKACRRSSQFIQALKGVDLIFNIADNENIICVVGPNGCGKSTLFKSIVMLHKYTHGDVYINGRSVMQSSVDRRAKLASSMGICLQDDAILYDTFTTRENLLCYHKISLLNMTRRYGSDKQQQKQVTWNIHDQVINNNFLGLQQHLDKKVATLSGGWKRRLSVACSLCNNPSILLLDEPTSGLDITARMELWSAIRELAHNRTIIVSTHSLEDADVYCKKLVFMCDGRIICIGKPAEIAMMNRGRVLVAIKYPIHEHPEAITLDNELSKQQRSTSEELKNAKKPISSVKYYNIHITEISLAELFSRLNTAKSKGIIADFTISQPSLDQTYLSLMKTAKQHFHADT